MLTFSRATNSVGVLLLPRLKSGGAVIPFSNRISPSILVSELPRLVRDVLGRDALALELNIKTAPAPAAAPAKPLPAAPRYGDPHVPGVVRQSGGVLTPPAKKGVAK